MDTISLYSTSPSNEMFNIMESSHGCKVMEYPVVEPIISILCVYATTSHDYHCMALVIVPVSRYRHNLIRY